MAKPSSKPKTDPRRQALDRGRTLLAAWGIHEGTLPPGTPGDQVVLTLSPLIGRDPACDLLIAEWLGRTGDRDTAEKLASWEPQAPDKDVKREIRRALFKLEQKGIPVNRREEPKAVFSLGVKPHEPEAYLGAPDGDGARMAWLLKRDASGYTGLFTVISDREGMLSVSAGTLTKQRLTDAIKEMASEGTGAPAPAPWPYVDALMHAAFRQAAPRPGRSRADYLLSRSEITAAAALPVPTCPVWDEVPASSLADPELLDASAELFKEKELGTWSLPAEAARTHLQALADLNRSGLVLSKETAAERTTAIFDAALVDFAASPLREILARRLEEMGYVLHRRGMERPARLALAVALALRSPEPVDLKKVSFLRAWVFRAFLPTMLRDRAAGARGAAPGEGEAEGAAPPSELAEGASRILDPSKVRETGVQGAGRLDDTDAPGLIIRP
ncbi:MAG: hypothetical protein HY049_09705 [Acidobacteria bacterium]|nr:hypothetical protein [Acidobacteriota bacterium]